MSPADDRRQRGTVIHSVPASRCYTTNYVTLSCTVYLTKPSSGPSNADTNPTWPKLESLSVHFHLASPPGACYFCGPDGESRDTEGYQITSEVYSYLTPISSDKERDLEKGENSLHDWDGVAASFRLRPIEETLTPFLTALTRAAQAMHRVWRTILWASMTWASNDVEDMYDTSTFDAAAKISSWHTSPLAWRVALAQAGCVPYLEWPSQIIFPT